MYVRPVAKGLCCRVLRCGTSKCLETDTFESSYGQEWTIDTHSSGLGGSPQPLMGTPKRARLALGHSMEMLTKICRLTESQLSCNSRYRKVRVGEQPLSLQGYAGIYEFLRCVAAIFDAGAI